MANPSVRAASINSDVVGTSAVGNRPTGTTNGDILIAAVALRSSNTITAVPSGWTLVATVGDFRSVSVYRKVASSEPASWTWTINSNDAWAVGVIAVADGASPEDASATGTTGGSTANQVAPSVTTTKANCMVLSFINYNPVASGATATPPSGMTEQIDNPVGTTTMGLWAASVLQASAGASGTKTFAMSQSGNSGCGITVAIGPGASTVTTDVTTSASINATIDLNVTTTAAIARTEVSSVTTTASLNAPITTDVTTDAAIEVNVATSVATSASIGITVTSQVTSTAALAMTGTSDVTSTASVSVAGTFNDVFSDASIGVIARETVITDAAIGAEGRAELTTTAAVGAGEYTPNHAAGSLPRGAGAPGITLRPGNARMTAPRPGIRGL